MLKWFFLLNILFFKTFRNDNVFQDVKIHFYADIFYNYLVARYKKPWDFLLKSFPEHKSILWDVTSYLIEMSSSPLPSAIWFQLPLKIF